MIKSFLIDRKVERQVMKTEFVTEPTEVNISEITHRDLMSMEFGQLRSFASSLRMAMQNVHKGNIFQQVESLHLTNSEIDEMIISHSATHARVPVDEPDVTPVAGTTESMSHVRGAKNGKTSKYHYVFLTNKDKKYRASVLHDGKSLYLGTFQDEIEAALGVDAYLDEIQDIGRPRNRDEFPKIMEKYKLNIQGLI